MFIPDESYYGTLGKIMDIDTLGNQPGVVYQNISKDTTHGHCARLSMWPTLWDRLWGYSGCKGEMINSLCNVGVEDLPALRIGYGDAQKEGCIIGNKFKLTVDASAVTCQMLNILENYGINEIS